MIHVAQISEGTTRNTQTRRTGVYDDSRGRDDGANSCAPDDDRTAGPPSSGDRDNGRAEIRRNGSAITWHGQPGIPSTGLPHPSHGRHEHPVAVAVRRPSPRIRRGEHVPVAGIEPPGAVHEGIPPDAGEVGLPHHAVAGNVAIRAVIVQVAHSVTVGRGIILGVLVVIGIGLLVPRIERSVFNIVGQRVFVVAAASNAAVFFFGTRGHRQARRRSYRP